MTIPTTLLDVLLQLRVDRYNGEMVIRFAQGHPRVVEFPVAPQRIDLDRAQKLREATRSPSFP